MDDLIQKLHTEYVKNLKYFNYKNKYSATLIAFSGVPGSGKTTLAKKIEERFSGIRINNDEIREVIKSISQNYSFEQIQDVLHKYLEFLIKEIKSSQNQFIILDSSIDRTYKKLKSWADELGFRLVIIRIKSDKDLIIKRINERNGKDAHLYLEKLDVWFEDNEKFNAQTQVDLTLNAQTPEQEVFNDLELKLIKKNKGRV